ncbi:MAG: AsmA-like C-terminal domain-containing protein, partial [Pseudomonadota bacterium]
TADLELDFAEARLSLDEIDWVKEAGDPATGELLYRVTPDGPQANAQFDSETTRLLGNLTLGSDGRILSADLERAFIQDKLDVTGTIRRDDQNNVSLALKGANLDVSDVIAGGGNFAFGAATSAAGQQPAEPAPDDEKTKSGTLSLSAEVDHLILNDELDIFDADLTVFGTADKVQQLEATGTTSTDAFFIASFSDDGKSAPQLGFSTGDAGFLANALLDVKNLTGGKLDVKGRLAYGGAPTQFDITLSDARLTNAPVFAQILSLASLQGLSDTLGGEGVMFTEVSLPLTIDGQTFRVSGGRASGPAIGLTAKGWVDLESRQLDVNGVLVPSFGLNSALGEIPLIGDLVVGRRGEGIFSLTYAVDGTLEEARVSINPLSAITPGILRRLFEAPEREIDELRPVDLSPDNDPDSRGQ